MSDSGNIGNAGYVHVWVASLPKDKIDEFMEILTISAQVMRDSGALAVVDTVGENIPYGKMTSFPRALMMQENSNEVVWCQQTYYASFEESQVVEGKYMSDPRIAALGDRPMPYDGQRVFYAGFQVKAVS
jgi:uncharacterized protein YbaA (DUF1428 family)